MKKNLPDFISTLSGYQFDILDELFTDKYAECIEMYWIIRNYTDYISELVYEQKKRALSLNLTVKLKGIKSDTFLENIKDTIPDTCTCKFDDQGKNIIGISIRKKKKKK